MKFVKNKKGFEVSFGWIFSVIVGAAVIVLAIYASTKFVYTERIVQDTEIAKEIGILFKSYESELDETKKPNEIRFVEETRLNNVCGLQGTFGSQKISVSTRSGVGKPWQKSGVESTFYDEYLFSSSTVEGKELRILNKPLEMPYKVGSLTFIWSEKQKYCLVNPPIEIEEDIKELNLKGLNFTSSIRDCERDSKKVCFSSLGCDIDVNLQAKSVRKDGQTVYYTGPLIYGAILSDPGIYECQVKRLMKRNSQLALIYLQKSEYISSTNNGCSSNLQGGLLAFSNMGLIENSRYLMEAELISNDLKEKNDAIANCKIF